MVPNESLAALMLNQVVADRCHHPIPRIPSTNPPVVGSFTVWPVALRELSLPSVQPTNIHPSIHPSIHPQIHWPFHASVRFLFDSVEHRTNWTKRQIECHGRANFFFSFSIDLVKRMTPIDLDLGEDSSVPVGRSLFILFHPSGSVRGPVSRLYTNTAHSEEATHTHTLAHTHSRTQGLSQPGSREARKPGSQEGTEGAKDPRTQGPKDQRSEGASVKQG
eukprot:TCALIF_03885-PB protein Name:"Protein of unknown function" AED:0.95 eAED:1.00 QI:0/0/0/0.33/1/1/3/0/219